ncbi:hypothetical protein [Gryllotalpicola ginsengisoli]|uniref:hypothetical protein n=1 Tax=Gryllotalpicola ginsengisoli TaxID=444608 RepID=UPI0003B61EC6|nr:hypothetical protein [Gryllotalpicola ginsengisoli]
MTVIKLVIAGIFFVGGFVLFAIAPEVQGVESLLFFCGILAIALSFALPIHVFSKS